MKDFTPETMRIIEIKKKLFHLYQEELKTNGVLCPNDNYLYNILRYDIDITLF